MQAILPAIITLLLAFQAGAGFSHNTAHDAQVVAGDAVTYNYYQNIAIPAVLTFRKKDTEHITLLFDCPLGSPINVHCFDPAGKLIKSAQSKQPSKRVDLVQLGVLTAGTYQLQIELPGGLCSQKLTIKDHQK